MIISFIQKLITINVSAVVDVTFLAMTGLIKLWNGMKKDVDHIVTTINVSVVYYADMFALSVLFLKVK